MTCETKKPNKESYEFFENFDYYVDHAEKAESINSVEEIDVDEDADFYEEMCLLADTKVSCNAILNYDISDKIQFSNKLCKKFKKIYNKLSSRNTMKKKSGELGNDDSAFLNYWLNDKLRDNNNDLAVCVKEFYQVLRKMDGEYFKIKTLEDKLYNMTKHDFENIKKLYELYNIKKKISGIIGGDTEIMKDGSCSMYADECYRKYREVIINCHDGCTDFFNALIDFKNKYKDEIVAFANTTNSCSSSELSELPSYEYVLKEHKSEPFKKIITLPVLFPLLGLFFTFIFSDTFTPFRQHVLGKIKRTKYILFDDGEIDSELLSYTSDNYYRIGDQQEYNISYYSV
ncbi:PIR Superfamily Protein [Plasmodium ovale wallikeri]|uniref:PIR Superfamily Protein n=1 Tax=Plasmodium ovale wallikeri TaxID=864142 RepID=A0A1A9AGQ9_PLAOA|nr:PIR Superfamily Protein [Plasmodium ovale wallikeri]